MFYLTNQPTVVQVVVQNPTKFTKKDFLLAQSETVPNPEIEESVNYWFHGVKIIGTISYKPISDYSSIPLFSNISYRDISQGKLGDCYFLAALAEVAIYYPDRIRALIKPNDDNTYTIRNLGGITFNIDDQLPNLKRDTGENLRYYAKYQKNSWVALLEKAYAYANSQNVLKGPIKNTTSLNDYSTLNTGYAYRALKDILNKKTTYLKLDGLSDEELNDLLQKPVPKVLVSKKGKGYLYEENGIGIVESSHEYAFVGPDEDSTPENPIYNLFNPWGIGFQTMYVTSGKPADAKNTDHLSSNGLLKLSLSEIREYFTEIDYLPKL